MPIKAASFSLIALLPFSNCKRYIKLVVQCGRAHAQQAWRASLIQSITHSDDGARLILELDALHSSALEGITLNGLLVEWHERLLEEVVRIRHQLFELLTRVRCGSPAGLHARGENLTLVVDEVVVIVFFLLHCLIESCLGALEPLPAYLCLQVGTGELELICSLSGYSETTLVEVLVDSFIVGSGQHVDSVELAVRQLVSWQALDILLQLVGMVCALAPRLLGRAWLLRQQLLHALLRIPFVILRLRASVLLKRESRVRAVWQ